MNGRRAKLLRRVAAERVKNLPPEQREYRQLDNCLSWRQAVIDGKPQYDGDGVALLEMYKAPGTIYHMQPFIILYHILKKKYYQRRARERGQI